MNFEELKQRRIDEVNRVNSDAAWPQPSVTAAPFIIISGNWNRRRHKTIEEAAEYAGRVFGATSNPPQSFHIVRIVADVKPKPPEPAAMQITHYFAEPKAKRTAAKRKVAAKRKAPARKIARATRGKKWPASHSGLTQPFARDK